MTNSQRQRARSVIPISCALVFVCVVVISPPLNAQSLPSPWVAGDVGNPVSQGSAAFSNDMFRIRRRPEWARGAVHPGSI